MFEKSAEFYDKIYSWKDYEGESAQTPCVHPAV